MQCGKRACRKLPKTPKTLPGDCQTDDKRHESGQGVSGNHDVKDASVNAGSDTPDAEPREGGTEHNTVNAKG